ncbi:YiiX/YebB-like N1pC/P60 family cysteine hydrolase [Pseudalkalibacillus sp. SCS-8]|uniref:YiiX/YebB-like N1pC/P60 family cysteine hydrolase n=1 Tax=Pseudalkalibacillus nanhaiensis TaxID=3115291 RepID=UPI0032D9FF74
MFKKISVFSVAVALSTSLLTNSVYANNSTSSLSYQDVVSHLNSTKESIEGKMDISLNEKEKISKESYKLVNKFLDKNRNLTNQELSTLFNSLDEIDGLMYNVKIEKGNTNFGSKSISFKKNNKESSIETQSVDIDPGGGGYTYWSGKGDILISLEAKTYNFPHGHAAILSTIRDYAIEALPGHGVVQHSATKYWSGVSDEGQYYVRGAADVDYIQAVEYAKNQIGEPYKLKTSLNDTSQWYCSKLVYKAWRYAGYHVGTYDAYLGLVLPKSIIADWDTVKYKNNPY